ncbi:MAG: exonuclease SbcCD subunit D [Clostridiales bacterium]|nr:exonuclease SbcCD subunit D [Clostridiales bacterium]
MKFLHLSDLHLGKQMNDLSLLADQEVILQQIVSIAQNEQVDAVLIAGDVYQRSSPQAEAMALFDRFVTQLVSLGKKIFVISGNHDSALRISYFSSLVRTAGVYVTEAFEGAMQSISLKDGEEDVVIWMLPFLRPAQVKRKLPQEKITTYQEAVEAVLRQSNIDPKKRNILMCHQFITGCETSDSEERSVGGVENIDASVFDVFDYVALGHIHKPQKILRDTLRYAGSPLKYSFSEHNHKKSVTVIDMPQKGNTLVRTIPLKPLHDVRLIEGTMVEIACLPYSEDYVWVTVHDELVPPDARVTLSVTFPNMMKFSVVNSKTKYDMDVLATQSMEDKSVSELFADFYRLQNNDQPPGPAYMKVLDKVLKELEEDHNEAR